MAGILYLTLEEVLHLHRRLLERFGGRVLHVRAW